MRKNIGSALIEVIVVSAIFSTLAISFINTFYILSRFHEKDMFAMKGQLLAEEGLEALRLMKSTSWSTYSSIPNGTSRYFEIATSSWGVTTTPEIIDEVFYRSFTTESVSRDMNSDIVSSGGTIDPDILLFDVSVCWNWKGSTTTVNYETYMTTI